MNRHWELVASASCGIAVLFVPELLADNIPINQLERTRNDVSLPIVAGIVLAGFGFVFAISARRQRGITRGRVLAAWLCLLWNGYILLMILMLILTW